MSFFPSTSIQAKKTSAFEKNLDIATGMAEILLGFEMIGGGGGLTIGTVGIGAIVGVPMAIGGGLLLFDGARRLAGAAIADSMQKFSNVLYSRRSSSRNVDFDKLLEAGKAHDRGGLTKAGRGLAKHGGREGSHFPKPKGNPSNINKQGQELLEKILKHPNKNIRTRVRERYGEIIEIKVKKLGGVHYTKDGEFIGFLQPN